MDHPYHLMSSSFVNSHITVPGRGTKATPSVVDRRLDVATDVINHEVGVDLSLYSNPTLIPDRFFFSFTPIITIRHPAHATPSAYRAWLKMGAGIPHFDFPVSTSYKFERLVFESFKSYAEGETATMPIVVEGEKLVRDPQAQMKKVCNVLGLNEGEISYSWDSPERGKGTKAGDAFFKTLNGSNGIIPDSVGRSLFP